MWKVWIFTIFGVLSILLILSNACAQAVKTSTTANATNSSSVPSISVEDASALIQKYQNDSGFVIIDVRTAVEFSNGHLARAVNIDYYSADFKAQVDKLDRNKEYLIYCQTGIRGAGATQIMVDLGFKSVHNLSGGIVEWMNGGNPVVR